MILMEPAAWDQFVDRQLRWRTKAHSREVTFHADAAIGINPGVFDFVQAGNELSLGPGLRDQSTIERQGDLPAMRVTAADQIDAACFAFHHYVRIRAVSEENERHAFWCLFHRGACAKA